MRISVKGVLLAVAAVAVSCAALINANDVWAAVVYGVTLGCLFVAIVGAIFRRGHRRAFWAGFAVFGWGYFLLMGATLENPLGGRAGGLPTSLLLVKLHDVVATEDVADVAEDRRGRRGGYGGNDGGYGGGGHGGGYGGGYGGASRPVTPRQLEFAQIGHLASLLLFACAGGLVGQQFFASSEREKSVEKDV